MSIANDSCGDKTKATFNTNCPRIFHRQQICSAKFDHNLEPGVAWSDLGWGDLSRTGLLLRTLAPMGEGILVPN